MVVFHCRASLRTFFERYVDGFQKVDVYDFQKVDVSTSQGSCIQVPHCQHRKFFAEVDWDMVLPCVRPLLTNFTSYDLAITYPELFIRVC